MPSSEYFRALENAKKFHGSSKTFAGKLLRPHATPIKQIVNRLGVQSILDYGCGKGEQYLDPVHPLGVTLEQYWGLPVDKYDPAYPPYAEMPQPRANGRWDMVLCTHTLGSIPIADLNWFIVANLYASANKVVYIAEKLTHLPKTSKREMYREFASAMPHGWTAEQWLSAIPAPPRGLEIHFVCREKLDGEKIATQWVSQHNKDWTPVPIA